MNIVRVSLADINAVLIGKAIKCADSLKVGQIIHLRDRDDRREIIAKVRSINRDRGCAYFINPQVNPDFVPKPIVVEKKTSKPKKTGNGASTRTSKSIHIPPRKSKEIFCPQTELERQTPEFMTEWKISLLQQRLEQKRAARLVKQRMEGA